MYDITPTTSKNYKVEEYGNEGFIKSLIRTKDNTQYVLDETVLINPFTKVEIEKFLIVAGTAFILHNEELTNIDEIINW